MRAKARSVAALSAYRAPNTEKVAALLIALREFHFECIEEQLDEQNEVRAHGIDMTDLPTRGTSAAANFISFLY
jgi:hypothetical protein